MSFRFIQDFPRRKQPASASQQQQQQQQGNLNYLKNLRSNLHVDFLLGIIDRIGNQTVSQFRPHFGMYFKTQLLETSKGRDLGL